MISIWGGDMLAGRTHRKWRQLAILTLATAWLAGCSSQNTRAPISSVNGKNPASQGGMLSSSPQSIPSQRTIPAQQTIQPVTPRTTVTQQTTQPQRSTHRHQQVVEQPVQMRDGKIVYNRKYGDIPKGSYDGGGSYTVKHGDTLFYIAWITGNDFRDLAQRNHIAAPYSLTVGQTLSVGNASGAPITGGNAITAADARDHAAQNMPQNTAARVAPAQTITYSGGSGNKSANEMLPAGGKTATKVTAPPVAASTANNTSYSSSASDGGAVSSWRWPTSGNIIENFSASEGGNKGIDIAGSKGQAILATADGRVVYAGNALRGYGNLIIIKHNDDYLSAYAHNETMLVREQQEVKAGQKIATMGSTGTSSTRLHFEIRYKGKSVNPLRYLPQR